MENNPILKTTESIRMLLSDVWNTGRMLQTFDYDFIYNKLRQIDDCVKEEMESDKVDRGEIKSCLKTYHIKETEEELASFVDDQTYVGIIESLCSIIAMEDANREILEKRFDRIGEKLKAYTKFYELLNAVHEELKPVIDKCNNVKKHVDCDERADILYDLRDSGIPLDSPEAERFIEKNYGYTRDNSDFF